MKTKEWMIVIVVMIIVAVAVSLITVNMTGNVIKVNPVTYGTNIYTKAEIDTKLKNIYTKNQIDTTLKGLSLTPKNCLSHSFSWSAAKNGTAVCKDWTNNKCLIAKVTMDLINNSAMSMVGTESKFIPCIYNFEDFDEDEEMDPNIGISLTSRFEVICCD